MKQRLNASWRGFFFLFWKRNNMTTKNKNLSRMFVFFSWIRGLLTFFIGMLFGWRCARWNSLRRPPGYIHTNFTWFLWKERRRYLFFGVRAPACVRELCPCRLPLFIGQPCKRGGKSFFEGHATRTAKSTRRFLLLQAPSCTSHTYE